VSCEFNTSEIVLSSYAGILTMDAVKELSVSIVSGNFVVKDFNRMRFSNEVNYKVLLAIAIEADGIVIQEMLKWPEKAGLLRMSLRQETISCTKYWQSIGSCSEINSRSAETRHRLVIAIYSTVLCVPPISDDRLLSFGRSR
jgi:hypothetical protein